MKHIFLSLLLLLAFIISPIPVAEAIDEPVIAVKLKNYLGNQTEITIKTEGDYLLNNSNVKLGTGEYKIKVEDSKLNFYKGTTKLGQYDSFSLNPLMENQLLYINNRPYFGSFQFVTEILYNKTYIRPINSIKIEDYLKGVVPKEMHATWEKEALKAQAVAARTYALTYKHKVIDDTILFQVYGGNDGHPNTDIAVKETSGMVLKHNGRLISAVFSASNGGRTESNSNAWGTTYLPYFEIKGDPFDPKTVWRYTIHNNQIDMSNKNLSSPNEWWNNTVEKDALIAGNIKTWLKNNGYYNKDIKIVSISNFDLNQPSSGGRVTRGSMKIDFFVKDIVNPNGELVLQTKEWSNTSASVIRAMVGNRTMLSYFVDKVEKTTDYVIITGKGDGHGVGLSQWGAQNRALAGQKYNEILAFYYPTTQLVKDYNSSSSTIDTNPPVIKDVKTVLDTRTNKMTISFQLNEATNTTVYMKNSAGSIIQYLTKEASTAAGANTYTWDTTNISNGNYSFGIISVDTSGNKSSYLHHYKLTKISADKMKNRASWIWAIRLNKYQQ